MCVLNITICDKHISCSLLQVDVYGFRRLTYALEWMGIHALSIFILVTSNLAFIAIRGFYWHDPKNNIVSSVDIGMLSIFYVAFCTCFFHCIHFLYVCLLWQIHWIITCFVLKWHGCFSFPCMNGLHSKANTINLHAAWDELELDMHFYYFNLEAGCKRQKGHSSCSHTDCKYTTERLFFVNFPRMAHLINHLE